MDQDHAAPEEDDLPMSREDGAASALVQEASCTERVIVLKVRVPGRTSLIIVGAPRSGAAGAGLFASNDERRVMWGGRLPPGTVRQRAREDALTGARVMGIGEREAFIDQHGDLRVVRAETGRVVVTDERASPNAIPFLALTDEQRRELEERGRAIAEAISLDAVEARRAEIVKVLERAKERIARRSEAIRGDIDKIGQADKIAAQAQWLVAEAARTPRGATKLVVTDWSSGEAVTMHVPLDPSKSPKDQVAAMFKRAKRLRLGAAIAGDRLAQAERQRDAIANAEVAVRTAASLGELEEVLRDAKKAAPRDVNLPTTTVGAPGSPTGGTAAVKKKKNAKAERTPYRTFYARSGRKLLVGKGAADNDALTLKIARPHDLWLHAKDRTGAHVIVVLDKGHTCDAADLVDAAHLAAHFSEAREEKVVDVQYTERRYIRKPKGSAAGAVMVDREKVLVLRVEPDTLRGLLEREDV